MSVSPERMKKLDRTLGKLGIIDLQAQKKNKLWIIAVKTKDVTAIAIGDRFSYVLIQAIERLHEKNRGDSKSLPS